jgi:hypothetical protein
MRRRSSVTSLYQTGPGGTYFGKLDLQLCLQPGMFEHDSGGTYHLAQEARIDRAWMSSATSCPAHSPGYRIDHPIRTG